MAITLLGLFTGFFHPFCSSAQSAGEQWPESLASLFSRSAQAFDEDEINRLNDSITIILREFLKTDSVFDHNFTNVRYLGQITSPDSLVKFITWNQRLSETDIQYNLFVVTRDSVNAPIQSGFYKSRNGKIPVNEGVTVTESNWYGALYYDIRPFVIDSKKYYVLLGLDLFSPVITRKVIEIAQFERGRFKMGFPFISLDEKYMSRLLFNYSSSVSMTVRFHSQDTIVYDHLSPRDSSLLGDYRYYGPDFSYDALIFDGKRWVRIEDFDARNREIQK